MAVSAKYGWPLPDLPDAPNIPYDMAALATAIENTDTGWRDVSGLLINGWTKSAVNGRLHLRRIGAAVTLAANIKPPATWNGLAASAPPTGFAPSPSGAKGAPLYLDTGAQSNTSVFVSLSNMLVMLPAGVGASADGAAALIQTVDWLTDAPWPTTLPGVPV